MWLSLNSNAIYGISIGEHQRYNRQSWVLSKCQSIMFSQLLPKRLCEQIWIFLQQKPLFWRIFRASHQYWYRSHRSNRRGVKPIRHFATCPLHRLLKKRQLSVKEENRWSMDPIVSNDWKWLALLWGVLSLRLSDSARIRASQLFHSSYAMGFVLTKQNNVIAVFDHLLKGRPKSGAELMSYREEERESEWA